MRAVLRQIKIDRHACAASRCHYCYCYVAIHVLPIVATSLRKQKMGQLLVLSCLLYVCMYLYIYVYMYMSMLYIYIYIRLYAELCTYDMIDYVLILRASLLQDSFRIDSAGFFTTGSISY